MQKYPPLRGNNGKRHTNIAELCNIKNDCTSRLTGCQHLRRDMLLISVSFQTLTDMQSKKDTKTTEMLRAFRCSRMFTRFPTLLITTAEIPRTRVFRRIQKKTYRDPEKRVFSSKLPTTCNVRYTQSRRENNVQQRREKTRST